MNGYSKMKMSSSTKSRSMDWSNLNFSSDTLHQPQEDPSNHNSSSIKPQRDQDGEGERFGVVLRRNFSSASQRFRRINNDDDDDGEKSNGTARTKNGSASTLEGVVRRAFSMRKSSSVGDGYGRIHDTGGGDAEVIEEEGGEEEERPTRMKKKKGNIFRACKRLFKF